MQCTFTDVTIFLWTKDGIWVEVDKMEIQTAENTPKVNGKTKRVNRRQLIAVAMESTQLILCEN